MSRRVDISKEYKLCLDCASIQEKLVRLCTTNEGVKLHASKAIQYLDYAIKLIPEYWKAYYQRGRAKTDLVSRLKTNNDYLDMLQEAKEDIDEVIRKHPYLLDAILLRSWIEIHLIVNEKTTEHFEKKLLEIIKDIENLIEFSSDLLSSKIQSDCYNVLGFTKMLLGQTERSVEVYQQAIQINEANFLGYRNLGILMESENNLELAKYYYNKALEIKTDNNVSKGHLARLEKRYEEAIDFYKTQLSNIAYFDLFYGLGCCYFEIGKLDEAYENFIQCGFRARKFDLTHEKLEKVIIEQKKRQRPGSITFLYYNQVDNCFSRDDTRRNNQKTPDTNTYIRPFL